MVDRYNASTAVPTAPVARPRESGDAMLAEAVHGLGRQAVDIATKKVQERAASLEAASINSARLVLAKRGGQLAQDLQKDRIAGSNYVPDLEKARSKLKDEIWGQQPALVQRSARARAEWDDIWTADEIASTRSAVAWQAGQEKSYGLRSLNDALAAMTAQVETDPSRTEVALEGWNKTLPAYAGLLDAETLEDARVKGAQGLLQASVRGLAKQGKFDEAEKVVVRAAAQLDPQQRRAFEAVIEDAKNDIEREKNRQETELRLAQNLSANMAEIEILDGKIGRQQIDLRVAIGDISVNDAPALIRAHRAYEDSIKFKSKLNEAQIREWADWSMDARQMLETMAPSQFMMPVEQWPESARALYDNMDPDRKRQVRQRQLDMKQKGETQDAAMATYRDLVARARPLVPKGWKLSSDSAFGEGDGLEFSGRLYALASRYAQTNGGAAVPEKEAREIIARALYAFKPYKPGLFGSEGFELPLDLEINSRLKLTERLGRQPTEREVADYLKDEPQ